MSGKSFFIRDILGEPDKPIDVCQTHIHQGKFCTQFISFSLLFCFKFPNIHFI